MYIYYYIPYFILLINIITWSHFIINLGIIVMQKGDISDFSLIRLVL